MMRFTDSLKWALVPGLLLGLAIAAPVPAQEPSEDDDRTTLDIELAPERGGGRVRVWAGDYQYQRGEYILATGGVRLAYKDLQLQADVVRLDIPANLITAEGSVVLDEGPQRLVGDTIEYNVESRTGRVTNAKAFVDQDYIFTGDEIAKVDTDTYTLENGVFTSCSAENPPWSIAMGKARITLDDYARIKNARMRIKGAPILYVPRLVWPTKTDRSSGLLIPQPGFSERRGFELSLAYYKTLGRSADTTFFADLSSKEFFGFGNEVRYRPTESTSGVFEAFLVQDQDFKRLGELSADALGLPDDFGPYDLPDENRWKVSWAHETNNLWGGFRGVINFRDYSDPTYRQDFERAVGRQTANFIYSQAYLTRNFGNQSLNILIDLRERLSVRTFKDPDSTESDRLRRVGRITDTRQQLPEIEYRLRPTQLGGTPIYFSLDTNLHYLSIENESQTITERYGRGDIFPSFAIPLSTLPWLSVKVDLGGRVTHYTNSIDPTTHERPALRRFSEQDESLTRTFGIGGAEIVGPTFSRIFEKKKPGRFSKLKHIVEPRITYRYLEDFEDVDEDGFIDEDMMIPAFSDEDRVPLFDEIDRRRLRNEANVAFINRIMAKPADEEEGGAFEIASFELSQAFSFDNDLFLQRGNDELGVRQEATEGPLRGVFRFNPVQSTSFKAEARYNTLFNQMQSVSLSGSTRVGRHEIGGSLFTRWDQNADADISSNQVRFNSSFALTSKFTFDANVSYDIERSELLQQRYFINYEGSCYNLRFELRESKFGDLEDRDFRFAFSLKNVGTFIDLNGSAN